MYSEIKKLIERKGLPFQKGTMHYSGYSTRTNGVAMDRKGFLIYGDTKAYILFLYNCQITLRPLLVSGWGLEKGKPG